MYEIQLYVAYNKTVQSPKCKAQHAVDGKLLTNNVKHEDVLNLSNLKNFRLHFRPKTPPPSPPHNSDDQFPISLDTPLTVELRAGEPSIEEFQPFTTTEFTLGELYGELPEADNSGSSLDISGDDLLTDNFTGLTEAQVESILSDTGTKM